MDGVTGTSEAITTINGDVGGGEERDENYLTVILAVSIPCGVVIVTLVIIIIVIVFFTMQTSSSDFDEVEATYMRRRFQGLSLEEQRKMAARQKHKGKKNQSVQARISTRRSSSTTDSSKSSIKLTPYSKRAKVRQGNPFGLQDWQLRMTGIDTSPIASGQMDLDNELFPSRSPIGALNPLMLDDNDESTADYEPAEKEQRSKPEDSVSQEGGRSSTSSDSMNPYD